MIFRQIQIEIIGGSQKKFSKIIKKYGTFFNISLLIIQEDKEIKLL